MMFGRCLMTTCGWSSTPTSLMTRGRTLLSVLACDFGVVIDRAIGAPGHGKDIVDGLNATDKIYSMLAEHGGAVGKMSLAVEAERLLSDPLRAQGVKGESDKKRFAQAKMKERHYHVQDPSKVKFTGLSMTAVGFEKGEHNGLLAHYHLRADPDLGVGWVMVRRIPCACNPCLTQLDLPWSNGVERSKQPRYGPSTRCEKFEMFKQADGSSLNDWRLIQLVPKKESDPDEEVEAHDEVLMSMATMAAERVQVGGYGALATEDADGYYIFKWTSEPYTQQEDVELTQFTPEARADLSREPAAGGLEEEPEAGDDAEERREALEGRGRRDPRRDPSPRGSGARGGGER
mmetsp:Transcript_63145/g.167042  ORF Transcript_63145/g.167042 Transcript_63145/m.167042 type:complete len:346 (-) Transcript_63145:180-1217(-)